MNTKECATGDPGGFHREQARSIGVRVRKHGIENAVIYSSQWCRCMETAKLLGLGKVNPFPGLNSFFRDRSRDAVQTAEVRVLIKKRPKGTPLVLVTHQVNITGPRALRRSW